MTTIKDSMVYLDAVQRAEDVIRLLDRAIIYRNDGKMTTELPSRFHTLEDLVSMVNATAVNAYQLWNINGISAPLESVVRTQWTVQCADRDPLQVLVQGVFSDERIDVVHPLTAPGGRVFNTVATVANTAIAQMLLWLMTQDAMYPLMQKLTAEIDRRAKHSMAIYDVRGLFILHLCLSLERLVDRIDIRDDIPWEWQEPQVLQAYVELLQDTEHFHWCWSTMEIRHEM